MDLKPGVEIGGRYRIERVLDEDEAGTVLATRETQNGLLVALKVFPSSTSESRLISRFRRAQNIASPHVPKLFELGGLDDGRPFIAMEYLNGARLTAKQERSPLPIGEAVRVIGQACHAVAAAHDVGVVHRRLKTSRLFEAKSVDGAVAVRVLGFATAIPAREAVSTSELPADLEYLAPEQLGGIHNGDRSADIWALGVIFYQLLTGRLPFSGLTRKSVAKHILREDPKPPRTFRPDVPWQLEQAILRCLAKDAAARVESADALAHLLQPFVVMLAEPSRTRASSLPPGNGSLPPRSLTPPTAPPELPAVPKLGHVLSGGSTSTGEHTLAAFHRLRSDGQIEGIKVGEAVGSARPPRPGSEAPPVRLDAPRRGVSLPPLSPAPAPSIPPPASRTSPHAQASEGVSTTSLVAILIVAAVVLGLAAGVLFLTLSP